MNKKAVGQLLVNKRVSIKKAMQVIDNGSLGVVFVIDRNKKLRGVATDGDIRRAILGGVNIDSSIGNIINKTPIVIGRQPKGRGAFKIKNIKGLKGKIPIGGSLKVPVLDSKGRLNDILFVYSEKGNIPRILKTKAKLRKEGIKKILVIGGAGYLGSMLCRKLLKEGYKVKVLDNLNFGQAGIKELYSDGNFSFLNGDIRNVSDIVEAVKDVNAVIHLAAIVGRPACAADPQKTLEVNHLATKVLAETCKYFQVNRFIFASTCSVYGRIPVSKKELTEESLLRPLSLYAESKIKCEQAILEVMDENFSPTIFRMATLYGYSPSMRFDLVLNLLTAQAIFDKQITIYGGGQWRAWLHVEDAVRAYMDCLESPIEKVRGEIFNVLSENYKIIEIGKIIKSVFPGTKIKISREAGDNRSYRISFKKIARILNYEPGKKVKEGVAEIRKVIARGLVGDYRSPQYRQNGF